MLRNLRSRLTYANVTSSLALFLVVAGGGAYASHELINSSDVVDNSLTSADIQNLTLTTNDLGIGSVWGSRIKDNGVLSSHVVDNTLTGADINVSALTLQPGETVRGYVSGDFEAAASGGDWRAGVSFPIPASSFPAFTFVDGVDVGETCTGTVTNPTAPTGTICVYPAEAANPGLAENSHTILNADKFGFQVKWSPTAAGDTLFRGTYAFTQ